LELTVTVTRNTGNSADRKQLLSGIINGQLGLVAQKGKQRARAFPDFSDDVDFQFRKMVSSVNPQLNLSYLILANH